MDEADDPTGVRELLAGLPGPGPMPDDLVARIEASLAAERSARADTGGPTDSSATARTDLSSGTSTAAPGAGTDRVIDLASRRRRRVRLAGLAAAAVVVVGVAVPTISRLAQNGVSSAGSAASQAEMAGPGSAGPDGQVAGAPPKALGTNDSAVPSPMSAADATGGPSPVDATPSVRVFAAAEPFTIGGWTTLARAAMSGIPEQDVSTFAVATSSGAGRCLVELGVGPAPQVAVVTGTFGGEQAAALVLPDGSAYLVPDSCAVTGAEPIATGRIAP